MSILAPIIAAFTLANGAHHWHQQLRPFKSQQEQIAAIKQELAESPFTHNWNETDKEQFLKNKDFIHLHLNIFADSIFLDDWDGSKPLFDYNWHDSEIDYGSWGYASSDDGLKLLRLGTHSFFKAKNRHQMKYALVRNAAILSHEGVHHAQETEGWGKDPSKQKEDDADARGLRAIIDSNYLNANQKLITITSTHEKLNLACTKNHKRELVKDSEFNEISKDEFTKIFAAGKPSSADEYWNFKSRWDALHKRIAENTVPLDKPRCESGYDEHGPCKERIDLLQKFIKHSRVEIINETVRDEIAWQ